MKVIKPTLLGSDNFVSSNAVEIYPAWVAATAYVENDVVYFSTIKEYMLTESYASAVLSVIVGSGDVGFTAFIQTLSGGRMLGDISNSGAIDLADAIAALKNVTGLNTTAELYYISTVLIPALRAKILIDPTYSGYLALGSTSYFGGRLYKRITAGTTTTVPELDPANWLDIGPTNTHAMFDREVSTVTNATDDLTVIIKPGYINSLSLYGLIGQTLFVTVRNGIAGPIVYGNNDLTGAKEISLDGTVLTDWYQYFFEPFFQLNTVNLINLPPYADAHITVNILATGAVGCGVLDAGNYYDLGGTELGAQISITDFSRKTTDDFGVTTFVRRANARRMAARMMFDNVQFNKISRVLESLTATPCAWIGTDLTGYEPLSIFGWFEDASIDVAYQTQSYCSLNVQGLSS